MSPLLVRLRKFIGNRRRAPRYKARLRARLLLSIGDAKRVTPLEGYTRDISKTGLALIVPAVQVEGTYLTSGNYTLRVVLELPGKPVEIFAVPVRYEVVEEEQRRDCLIGAEITEISDKDGARYVEFIQTLS